MLFIEKLSMVVNRLLEVVYPPECPVCGRILSGIGEKRRGVHTACYSRLKRIVSPMCSKCGKPLLSEQQEYCYDCSSQRRSFEGGHGLWLYDRCSAASVFAFKYSGKRQYVDFYAMAMLHFYGKWMRSLDVQQLVPVPVSREKWRQRGYNQAELLAEAIGAALCIPVNRKGLVRLYSTAPQKELGREERRKNLENAFQAEKSRFEGIKRVLLIDDIYTTGSTVEYCTRALKSVGVGKVWFFTLCIGGAF